MRILVPSQTATLWRSLSLAALFLAAVLCVAVYSRGPGHTFSLTGDLHSVQQTLGVAANPKYNLEFVGYEPSAWEHEILTDIEVYKYHPELVCKSNSSTLGRLQSWLNTTSAVSDDGALQLDADVFSKFRYRDAATGQEVVTHIEPMARHFRHPLVPAPWCTMPGVKSPGSGEPLGSIDIQDRSYLLLLDLRDNSLPLPRTYPGRRYLFDLGTGLYPTGLTWFVENYGRRGVVFDEIWAWEVTERRPKHYWADVPPEVRSVLHYYNIPATGNATSPENPLNILRRVYRPGDFVVGASYRTCTAQSRDHLTCAAGASALCTPYPGFQSCGTVPTAVQLYCTQMHTPAYLSASLQSAAGQGQGGLLMGLRPCQAHVPSSVRGPRSQSLQACLPLEGRAWSAPALNVQQVAVCREPGPSGRPGGLW